MAQALRAGILQLRLRMTGVRVASLDTHRRGPPVIAFGLLTNQFGIRIIRRWNYSDSEGVDVNDEQLVDEAVKLLPEIVKGAHAAKACLPALAGLSLAQAKATTHLFHHGHTPVGQLAYAVGWSMPAASELVDRLVDEGYAEREINPADRRQVLVSLTPRAIEVAHQMNQIRRMQMRSAIARLEPDERPVFLRSLEALAAALREPLSLDGVATAAEDDKIERAVMKSGKESLR
jgi:DNA-binding MarR family transcriptional regulator